MKKENKQKTIKITIKGYNEDYHDYFLIKLKDAAGIKEAGNSERLSNALNGATVILSSANYRIYSVYNPHIAKRLKDAGVDGWRIDHISNAIERNSTTICRTATEREYIINLETFEAKPALTKTEAVCKTCGNITQKTQICGAYCENCLLTGKTQYSLAKRFDYHYFDGEFEIYENVNEEVTPIFGAEIERDFLGAGNFERDSKDARIAAVKAFYDLKKPCKRESVFEYDGSLTNGGVEWITYPATYAYYKKHAKKIDAALEAFRKYNFDASIKTGNHIHINRSFFDGKNSGRDCDKSRFAAAKMALILAENWKQFCAVAGRDINCTRYTEKPSQKKTDSVFTLARKTIENECAHAVAVNLQHAKTIEIRIYGGIKTAADLLLYIDITQALAKFAKKKSLEKAQNAKMADICAYLQDKNEHIPEIAKRLKETDQTADAAAVEAILTKKTEQREGL